MSRSSKYKVLESSFASTLQEKINTHGYKPVGGVSVTYDPTVHPNGLRYTVLVEVILDGKKKKAKHKLDKL